MSDYCFTSKKMSKRVEYAYNAWKNQRSRCRGKKTDPTYKGLSVDYSSREFVDWFLENTTEDNYKFIVGRINHSKGYSFDNIRLETRSESSLEVVLRSKRKQLFCLNKKTREKLFEFSGIPEASELSGLSVSAISDSLHRNKSGIRPSRSRGSELTFIYK